MNNLIKLMRPHHYIKNFLVFATLIFGGQLFNKEKFLSCVYGFAAFCMMSSVVYIFNDIRDRKYDRLHPVKCKRPIASGDISVQKATALAVTLLFLSMIFNFKQFHVYSTALIVLYLVLNLLYSLKLKNIPIVDVTILVSGFFIRIMYGAVITGITVSNWLYLTVVVMAFYFAFGKRRNELKNLENVREVLNTYTFEFLDRNMYMCMTLAIVFYSLWSMAAESSVYSKYFVFTVPVVLLICMKYNMNIEGKSDGDPVEVLLHDKTLIFLSLLYTILMFVILYA